MTVASKLSAFSRRAIGASVTVCATTVSYALCEQEVLLTPSAPVVATPPSLNEGPESPDTAPAVPMGPPMFPKVKRYTKLNTDSYPNFSRHGDKSLLKQYLTRDVYEALKDRRTSYGVTLEDCIRSGVSLPWGAEPPRGIAGVFVGDAESYSTFGELLNPLIEQHHKPIYRKKLQRHKTNLNPQELLQQKIDPDGAYILYTRLRLARSLSGFAFAPNIDRAARRHVERILRECIADWKNNGDTGEYRKVMDMSNDQHDDLIERQIMFPDPDEFSIAAGLARDWPDARGLYCDDWRDTPGIMIWCNARDHFWIISTAKGGDVQGVFTKLTEAVWALETSLGDRGHKFVEDPRLGFLNTSPANLGTALRASVFVKLVRLGQQPGFFEFIKKLRLAAYSEFEGTGKRYTGIFNIANSESLGKSEVTLINIMIQGVDQLIKLEKRLENGEELDLSTIEVEETFKAKK